MGEESANRIEHAAPPDAEGWITVTLEFESFEIARSNILGFGTMVEVLEPEDLRRSVMQIASAIVEFYRENG
jgi:predicted DNA-binding transcriptional regulator YafY